MQFPVVRMFCIIFILHRSQPNRNREDCRKRAGKRVGKGQEREWEKSRKESGEKAMRKED